MSGAEWRLAQCNVGYCSLRIDNVSMPFRSSRSIQGMRAATPNNTWAGGSVRCTKRMNRRLQDGKTEGLRVRRRKEVVSGERPIRSNHKIAERCERFAACDGSINPRRHQLQG